MFNRTYTDRHPRITTLRVHPAGELFVAGSESKYMLGSFETQTFQTKMASSSCSICRLNSMALVTAAPYHTNTVGSQKFVGLMPIFLPLGLPEEKSSFFLPETIA